MPGRHWILTSAALPKGYAILGREPMTLGREPGCELRLFALEVSRRHAQISRSPRGYSIQDLRSANGTFVNGKTALRPIALENGDLISVGAVQLQFLIVDAERDEIAQRFSPGLEETDHVVQSARSNALPALFSGSFTRDTLHQVIQLIELHHHAGVLRVDSAGCVGFLRLKDGLIVEARFGPATGERAARSLLGSLTGSYAFYPARAEAASGGDLNLRALAVIREILRSEESQERRAAEEGFLDERPASGISTAKNVPTPPSGARTQRIPRSELERRKREREQPPKEEPRKSESSNEWRTLFDKK